MPSPGERRAVNWRKVGGKLDLDGNLDLELELSTQRRGCGQGDRGCRRDLVHRAGRASSCGRGGSSTVRPPLPLVPSRLPPTFSKRHCAHRARADGRSHRSQVMYHRLPCRARRALLRARLRGSSGGPARALLFRHQRRARPARPCRSTSRQYTVVLAPEAHAHALPSSRAAVEKRARASRSLPSHSSLSRRRSGRRVSVYVQQGRASAGGTSSRVCVTI